MNNNKNFKQPVALLVGDTFSHMGTRYNVIAPVTPAEMMGNTTRMRTLVVTNNGDLRIPNNVPLKMV